MTIRTEFEKAMFNNPEYAKKHTPELMNLALWAAKWMGERCAEMASQREFGEQYKDCPAAWLTTAYKHIEKDIRQLIKELDQ